MTIRERQHQAHAAEATDEGPIQVDATEAVRDQAAALLAAADEAISRALSTDAEAFLLRNRQTGGQ
jgi:hypothetical protein